MAKFALAQETGSGKTWVTCVALLLVGVPLGAYHTGIFSRAHAGCRIEGAASNATAAACRCDDACASVAASADAAAGSPGQSLGDGVTAPQRRPEVADWAASPYVSREAVAAYTPSLSARELDRAIVSIGEPSRLRRAMAKLLDGKPISVTFLGGSLTMGFAADHLGETNFAARVLTWINQTFPRPPGSSAQHRLVNGGQGGTGSSYFTMCANRHVAPDADLIFLETNVNDGPVPMTHPGRRAHERLIRKLLRYPNRPAVVELLFFAHPAPSWTQCNNVDNVYNTNGDGPLSTLAQFYYLPWLSVRSLIWTGLRETRADKTNTEPGRYQELWHIFDDKDDQPTGDMDRDHPGEKGHHWMGDLIIRLLVRTLEDVARNPLEPADEEYAQAPLTEPLLKGNWEVVNNQSCMIREELKPYTTIPEGDGGWEWANEGKAECCPKWGLVSRKPGSSVVLTINTHVDGLGPKNNLTLGVGYLRSYEQMGVMEITCIEGCRCDPFKIDGHYPDEHATQLNFKGLLVSPAEKCQLRFTVLEETRSGQHKCNVLGIVFSEEAGYLISDGTETSIGPLNAEVWE